MSARVNEQKANEAIDKTAINTKEELDKLRAEYEDLKKRTQPKVEEAQTYLTSPSAIGFYQGFIVGAFVVLGYAKYKGGLLLP
ncbi:hypothetical protein G6F57_003318 [Rhizopus arrhizus]|uniref:Uncharacterized protein n=1 Tax=Rhizopus oryzae TaxID=64495 RepID=A0A9P7BVA6_RHIOR|nr:hypothetical protein G6F23_009226 [Rhizopus arrhizus]KAG1405771.1 hypothetical protein G6F58_009958 [Rhizopus delemar]KAG0767195.1 hypothetical protein G6F24_002988 [Rhizopus arrhizus]KAG0785849.1 hypothetical protein G6F22_007818 [Rhizopus arrhizus]KAG0793969.1 hypothetical protein G6F21_003227 [Rhizopus arrhizus]